MGWKCGKDSGRRRLGCVVLFYVTLDKHLYVLSQSQRKRIRGAVMRISSELERNKYKQEKVCKFSHREKLELKVYENKLQ